jgi:pullulanase
MVNTAMLKVDRVFEAYLDKMDYITILLPKEYGVSRCFRLKHREEEWGLEVINTQQFPQFTKYECQVRAYLELGNTYTVIDECNHETDLQIGAVIRTKEFDEAYYYDGNDLGVTYTPQSTVCKVWAPTASLAKTRIYEKTGRYADFPMKRERNGVWSAEIPGNREGALYTFLVCIN